MVYKLSVVFKLVVGLFYTWFNISCRSRVRVQYH